MSQHLVPPKVSASLLKQKGKSSHFRALNHWQSIDGASRFQTPLKIFSSLDTKVKTDLKATKQKTKTGGWSYTGLQPQAI